MVAWLTALAAALSAAGPAWASPALVSDINPGANSSNPGNFVSINGTLFFVADDGSHGSELWRSDGTAAGTSMVKDINPGNAASPPAQLTNVNGTLFFSADDGTNGVELWKSDGTAAGTTMVKDINPGSGSSTPLHLTNMAGTLFFSADDGTNGRELWKSDGSAAGTTMVKDINVGGSSNPTELVDGGGALFFHADDGVHGDELWRSDGTSAGTTLVRDIDPGGGSSNISEPTNVNGTVFFSAFDGNSFGLWKSDGTAAGTVLVEDVNSVSQHLTNVAGTLFFSADDGNNGRELWKSDGTAAGTVLVKDIFPGGAASDPAALTNFNGTLFFQANDGTNGVELWKSDGTPGGTTMVKDINPGGDSFPDLFTSSGGQLYFTAFEFTDGRELWKTDGTAAGTTLVADINPGANGSVPAPLADVNGTLLFGADDGTHGRELWTLGAGPPPRSTSTAVNCVPGSVTVGQATTCTATVTDTGGGAATTPTGSVSFTSDSQGTFGNPGSSCALAQVAAGQASCHVDYTPSSVDSGTHTITGSYGGDGAHAPSNGSASLPVTASGGGKRPSSTSLSCSPASATVGHATTCGAIVSDTGNGPLLTPTGIVHFSSNSPGTFSSASCTLTPINTASASCVVHYTPTTVVSGTHTLTGAYAGDGAHNGSVGRVGVAVVAQPLVPFNTALPSIVPDQSCQFYLHRYFCRTIPYQYQCRTGQWTGTNPTAPYQFQWEQLYYVRQGRFLVNPFWRAEPNGNSQTFNPVSHVTPFDVLHGYVASGAFRCVVTATGPGGSTTANSPAARLQLGPSIRVPRPTPVNIVVTGIEVTQAVQSSGCAGCTGTLPSRSQLSSNTPGQATYQGVTLAAGKFTVVRVFAHFLAGSTPTLPGATAQLDVFDSNGNRISVLNPDSSPGALTPPPCWFCVQANERAQPASSFNFLVPWQDTEHQALTFRATVTPRYGPFLPAQCGGCRGNTFTLSSVPFVQTAVVPIWPIPLTLGNATGCGAPGASGCTSQSPVQVFGDTQTVLPVQVQIFPYRPPLAIDGVANLPSQSVQNADDAEVANVSQRGADDGLSYSQYGVGVFYAGEGNLANGDTLGNHTLYTSGAASIVLDTGRPLTSVMHEIGHGLGLAHASNECGGGQDNDSDDSTQVGTVWPDPQGQLDSVGFDRRNWDIFTTGSLPSTFVQDFGHDGTSASGTKYYDFMSYCPGGDGGATGVNEANDWISLTNWNNLIAFHQPAQSLPAAADARAAAAEPIRVIAIVGTTGATSIFDVETGQRIPGRPTPGSPYRVELRSASGRVLTSIVPETSPFHVDRLAGGQRPALLLTATLPFAPSTAAVVITAGGRVLARRTRSAHAPTARFISPRRGALLGGGPTTLVRWSGRDQDGDRLTSKVEYSSDAGRDWKVIADGLEGNSTRVATRFLSASRNARLRVLVSDGFDVATVTSGRLRARGVPPTVQILNAPRRGHVLDTTTLLLQGSAFDDADRPLAGRHLKWYLGRRLIGTGVRVTLMAPKSGNTAVRLLATDSHGRKATATLLLQVKAVAARYLLFDAPLLVSPKARTVTMRIASSAPATFTIAGKHYRVGPKLRTIRVRVGRGKSIIRLACSLRSTGGVVRGTYVALR